MFNRKPRNPVTIDFTDTISRTEQHHKKDCDIRFIMRKYEKTGILNHVAKYGGTYGNMASAVDFKTAMDIIAQANSMFETVPSHIRAKFHNDPSEYLEFMQNPENYQAIADLGLDPSHLPAPTPPEVDPVAPSGDLPE